MRTRLTRVGPLAGGLFALSGLLAVWIGSDYPAGEARRMGPGWVPVALGWCLVALGAGIALAGVLSRVDERVPESDLRPLACLLAGVAAFGLLLEPAGLVAAILACVAIARLAERPYRAIETAMLAVFLAASGAAIFVYGLGLPIPLFGR